VPECWLVAVRAPGSSQRPTPALLIRTRRPSGLVHRACRSTCSARHPQQPRIPELARV